MGRPGQRHRVPKHAVRILNQGGSGEFVGTGVEHRQRQPIGDGGVGGPSERRAAVVGPVGSDDDAAIDGIRFFRHDVEFFGYAVELFGHDGASLIRQRKHPTRCTVRGTLLPIVFRATHSLPSNP